jgi:hypothetical protein
MDNTPVELGRLRGKHRPRSFLLSRYLAGLVFKLPPQPPIFTLDDVKYH